MFNTNLMEFITGRVNGEYKPGRDGSWVVTLPELFGAGPGPIGGMYGANTGGFTGVVKHNLEQNWGQLVMGAVGIPVIANVAKKFLRKPVLNPMNKVLKMAGLNDVKV